MKHRFGKLCLTAGLVIALCLPTTACSSLIEAVLNSGPDAEVVGTSHGMYAYETLSDEEKQVYDEITYTIEHRLESIKVSTVDETLLEKVFWAVYYDHCEYFWTDSYQYEIYSNYKDEPVKIIFYPIYNMDEEEQARYQKKIDQAVAEILADAPVDGTDYDKALYVYRTLIEQTDYDMEAEFNQNIVSTFVYKETVCRGYAYGAQYLLNELGVPCISICGMSEGEAHSWNLIQMDGDYYYMDATWGEVSYWEEIDDESGDQTEETGSDEGTDSDVAETFSETVNYSYFGVSDADTAFVEEHQAFDYVPLPACTATENNYYIHEGLYFEELDKSAIGGKIRQAYDGGEPTVALKFATTHLYDEAFKWLVDWGNWSYYCDLNRIYYVDHFEENVLLFEFVEAE